MNNIRDYCSNINITEWTITCDYFLLQEILLKFLYSFLPLKDCGHWRIVPFLNRNANHHHNQLPKSGSVPCYIFMLLPVLSLQRSSSMWLVIRIWNEILKHVIHRTLSPMSSVIFFEFQDWLFNSHHKKMKTYKCFSYCETLSLRATNDPFCWRYNKNLLFNKLQRLHSLPVNTNKAFAQFGIHDRNILKQKYVVHLHIF